MGVLKISQNQFLLAHFMVVGGGGNGGFSWPLVTCMTSFSLLILDPAWEFAGHSHCPEKRPIWRFFCRLIQFGAFLAISVIFGHAQSGCFPREPPSPGPQSQPDCASKKSTIIITPPLNDPTLVPASTPEGHLGSHPGRSKRANRVFGRDPKKGTWGVIKGGG